MRTLLLIVALLFSVAPAAALEPEHREVIVVQARVWDGFRYVETFLPSTMDELTLIAGEDSAISFVGTEEYYWPLSRQVYVDFDKRNEPLDGVLKVEKGGEPVADVLPQPYSIVYPDGAINGDGSLIWGAAAVDAFASYEAGERDFARRNVEAMRAESQYQQALLRAGARQAAGAPVETIAAPSPPPQPSLRLVTKPVQALRVSLAPGRYRIALWRDGREVSGTSRALNVIDAAQSAALVADIVPEERWTRPLAANSEAARIFVRPGATFYITLAEASRFDEADYLPVVSPQAAAVKGRNMWVRRKPFAPEAIALRTAAVESRLPLERLKVEQTQGAAFGYQVRAARDGETPDLSAFVVAVPDDGGAGRLQLSLPERGFERDVIVVQPRRAGLALALTAIPLMIAFAFAMRRRRAAFSA